MTTESRVSVAINFSRTPGPRYKAQGSHSGEEFRQKHLVPVLKAPDLKVVVDLDGTAGFGSSFLDEAFGGLIRSEGFTKADLKSRLKIVSKEDETYASEAWQSIEDARAEKLAS